MQAGCRFAEALRKYENICAECNPGSWGKKVAGETSRKEQVRTGTHTGAKTKMVTFYLKHQELHHGGVPLKFVMILGKDKKNNRIFY